MRHRFEVDGAPRVEVRIARGRVRVVPGDASVVEVETDRDDGLIVEQRGGSVLVHEEPGSRSRRRAYDLLLRLPADAALECNLATAPLLADAPLRDLHAKTATGDVRAVAVTRRLEARTASGDVDVDEAKDAEVSTASGDIRIERVHGALSCATASGDIRVGDCPGEAEVRTVSGEIVLSCFGGDDLSARTVSGDVAIGLPPGRRVRYELKTLSGSVSLPEGRGASTPGERRDVTLRVRSVSGDVRIRRA